MLNQSTGGEDKQSTARALVQSCEDYLKPPSSATKEARAEIEKNRKDVLLIESSTALDILRDAPRALEALDKLEKFPDLTPAARGLILRDRIKAYQIGGDEAGAEAAMQSYIEQFPKDAPNIIKSMIFAAQQEIDRVAKTDPAHAKDIAGNAVGLIKILIQSTKAPASGDEEAKKQYEKTVYTYKQILGDMATRAGQVTAALAVFEGLQKENKTDLFNKLGVARAYYADKQWGKAHDEFGKILPQLLDGSDSYWEVYLRMIQCNEGLATPDAKSEIVRTLKDLKASSGDLGGANFKADYADLVRKYDIK